MLTHARGTSGGGFERSLGGEAARQARARRQRTQSLRSRAFNQGYYHKFFDEEACLGRGAFGSVYLCHHVLGEVNLGKYAIKKVPVGNDHPRLAGTNGGFSKMRGRSLVEFRK
jgi:hypothetical protein